MFKNNKGKHKSHIPEEAEYTSSNNMDADPADFIGKAGLMEKTGFIEKEDYLKDAGFIEKDDYLKDAGFIEKEDYLKATGFTEKEDYLKATDFTKKAPEAGNSRLTGNLTTAEAAAIAEALITFKAPAESKPPTAQNPSSNDVPVNDPIDEAIAHNTVTGELLIPYSRQAMYYETDQMGVIHHSNYIRWFEESRIHFLEQIGLDYDRLESTGILIPVLGVSCEYKSSVRFHDKVIILPKITFFNGFKMTISYQIMDNLSHTVKAQGETKHCFVNQNFKPINIKKIYKDAYEILTAWVN